MAEGDLPIEWTGPATVWAAAVIPVFSAIFSTAAVLAFSLVGYPPPGTASLAYYLMPILVIVSLLSLVALVLPMVLPFPAPRFGVSPGGVVFDLNVRYEVVPMPRLRLVGRRLYVFPKRIGPVFSNHLNPYQATRLRHVLPGIVG